MTSGIIRISHTQKKKKTLIGIASMMTTTHHIENTLPFIRKAHLLNRFSVYPFKNVSYLFTSHIVLHDDNNKNWSSQAKSYGDHLPVSD